MKTEFRIFTHPVIQISVLSLRFHKNKLQNESSYVNTVNMKVELHVFDSIIKLYSVSDFFSEKHLHG